MPAGKQRFAMPMPLVSIVINNFNYARYLPRSIESALGQTHPRVEVLVVDDASTDDSRLVIGRYADRVTAILQEKNSGQAAAINAGFRASRGDILIFLDADDYLYPQAAALIAAAWVPGLSKAHYRLDLVDASGEKIDVYPPPEVRFDGGDVLPRLLATGRYETSVTSGNAFARDALREILPAPEDDFRISADGYLVTLSPFYGPVLSIEEPLGAYRQHGENAWALSAATMPTSALSERLRRSLVHDGLKHRVLEARARQVGLRMTPEPGMRDHQHLAARLASLRLDPARHPHPGDSRVALAMRGARASMGASTSWKRRVILAAWFLTLGFMPRPVASRAAAWRLSVATRPRFVDRSLKAVRRLVR
jgi:hypothetical protein